MTPQEITLLNTLITYVSTLSVDPATNFYTYVDGSSNTVTVKPMDIKATLRSFAEYVTDTGAQLSGASDVTTLSAFLSTLAQI